MNNARTAAIILIGVTAICIAVAMFIREASRNNAHVDIDTTTYTVKGIDISAHNGEIDFERVARDGVQFAFIKISEGATWRDSKFEENYHKATSAGIKVGVYHFFRFDVEGWRQSVNLLRALGHRHLDLPVAIDIEEWGNPENYSTKEVIENVKSLIDLIRRSGREAIIYTNKKGYSKFIRNHFDDTMLWICSFTDPAMAEDSRWTIWQYSHKGKIDGIDGDTDLCTFNVPVIGDFSQWLATNPAISPIKL